MASGDDGLVELLTDALSPLGKLSVRRMFGGIGVYLDGLVFALIFDGVAYFKVSNETRRHYEAEGVGPFIYETKHGASAINSYWRVPERLYDDQDDMIAWARAALAAARQAAVAKSKKATRKTSRPVPNDRPIGRSRSKPGG